MQLTFVPVRESATRQVRAKNGLVAISNYASGTVTFMTWNGSSPPAFARTFAFGPTPLEIDMAVLDNGNTAIAVVSATTNLWWLGELDGSGNQVNQWSGSMPCTGGLADVVFIPGVRTYLAIGCEDDGAITFIETDVYAPIKSQ